MQNTTKTTTRLQTLQRKELKFRKDFGSFMRKNNVHILQIVQDLHNAKLYHCIMQTQDAKNAFAFGRTPARSFYKMISRFNIKYSA